MGWVETAAALLALLNVGLLVGRSLWNYPFGLAAVALYAWVFAAARLYSDAALQGFFFAVQVYGWWAWARARRRGRTGEVEVPVARLGPARFGRWVLATGAAALAWGALMHRLTNAAAPFWDAAVAAYSVAAQLLLARRRLENWLLWIAVDAAAAALYASRGLYQTTGLYLVFLLLATWGLASWRRAAAAGSAA